MISKDSILKIFYFCFGEKVLKNLSFFLGNCFWVRLSIRKLSSCHPWGSLKGFETKIRVGTIASFSEELLLKWQSLSLRFSVVLSSVPLWDSFPFLRCNFLCSFSHSIPHQQYSQHTNWVSGEQEHSESPGLTVKSVAMCRTFINPDSTSDRRAPSGGRTLDEKQRYRSKVSASRNLVSRVRAPTSPEPSGELQLDG